jgi:hypothetical protein
MAKIFPSLMGKSIRCAFRKASLMSRLSHFEMLASFFRRVGSLLLGHEDKIPGNVEGG